MSKPPIKTPNNTRMTLWQSALCGLGALVDDCISKVTLNSIRTNINLKMQENIVNNNEASGYMEGKKSAYEKRLEMWNQDQNK